MNMGQQGGKEKEGGKRERERERERERKETDGLQKRTFEIQVDIYKGKGKAVPLQAWSGPEGSRRLMFPAYMTTAQDGGKVVSPTHRPPLPPGNAPGTHFC